jgi:alpha-galactosidase
LFKDFRPPSSGGEVGKYYTLMAAQVREALANLQQDFPACQGHGHELAGFIWYQGWNDGAQREDTAAREYEQNLVNLIHDVRKEFNAPKLPVVVGELTGPWVKAEGHYALVREAQSAATKREEFKGNVAAMRSEKYWDLELSAAKAKDDAIKQKAKKTATVDKLKPADEKAAMEKMRQEGLSERERQILEKGISNFEFHYLGSAKILGGIGKGLAESMVELRKSS